MDEPTATPSPWLNAREFFFNALLAAFFLYLAFNFLSEYQRTERLSSLLFVIFELIVVVVAFIRRAPKAVSWNALDWVYTALGSVLPLLLYPAPGEPNWFWFAVQCVGETISVLGIFTLNRSFGAVPANRGIKTVGLYHVVRHPIYCGYTLVDIAMVMQNFSTRNICLAIAHLIVQTLRILSEERLLLQDPSYAEYAARVKWRLLPGVW
ncbi:MAG TPA: isoprenylcysteine carboxylmethyltransferase family protein [Lacipirellulaceae bacterium]|jgi:protein-S-isoprenylcysteine O-methyltransferase Ste14|nr:isoprenylcysteine carboxylmethyltransferase family protein [Lacipirellulaceae bacterium]